MLAFLSMNLQTGHLSSSIARGGKEMIAWRYWSKPGRQDVRGALDQSYLRLFSYFSDPVRKFHMAYHDGRIGKGIAFHRFG